MGDCGGGKADSGVGFAVVTAGVVLLGRKGGCEPGWEGRGRAVDAGTEEFCGGQPVIASQLCSVAEVVQDGKTGVLVEPGDRAQKMRWASTHPVKMEFMERQASVEYEKKYTP